MLSAPDIAILGAFALLVFGPDQLPKVARKFGTVMRDVQNTSSQFIREMERAAEEQDPASERPHLEAVPSSYSHAEADNGAAASALEEEEEDEPMLPGIEPESATPKKTAEPAEF